MSEPTSAVAVAQPQINKSMIPFTPQNLNEAFQIASKLASSDLCPKSFGGKPENVLAAIMMGHELGLGVMQALTNIAVVNGRASVWGELVPALIMNSGNCELLTDSVSGEGESLAVTVKSKRRGMPEYSYTYTWADAKRAGLTSKDTYQKYPKDMLYWKALGRVSKRLWADVLKGISIREIAEEMETESVGVVEIVKPTKVEPIPAPAEPTAEELLKKAEEAKARMAEQEAAEAAEVKPEPKKRGPKPKAPEAPAEPVAHAEETVETEPVAESVTMNRAIGTLLTAIKLTDAKAETIGYAVKVQTTDGDQKFKVADKETALAAKPMCGKTVEVLWTNLAPAIEGVTGFCSKLNPVNK